MSAAFPHPVSMHSDGRPLAAPVGARQAARAARSGSPWEVLLAFLKLVSSSFGGPFAHLGYFRTEFVSRRKWVTEETYADLVALGQFLPGPASS